MAAALKRIAEKQTEVTEMHSPTKAIPKNGKLNLFLLEMIIVLLFFSVASAVILRAFVAADRISAENIRLERMAFCAQSAAESFSVTADLAETAEFLFGVEYENLENATRIEIPLDSKCEYSYMNEAYVFMTMQITGSEYKNRLRMLNISFRDKDGNVLYEINSAAYVPERTVLSDE